MKRLLLLAAFTALFVAPVSSASPSSALSVSPSVPSVGGNMVFAGCGYASGSVIQVQAVFNSKPATVIDQVGETTDANGCFSTADVLLVALYSGKWTANVFEANGHKDATLIFVVT